MSTSTWIGILQYNGGQISSVWSTHNVIDNGWNLSTDTLIAGHFTGKNTQELFIVNPNNSWFGLLTSNNGSLEATVIERIHLDNFALKYTAADINGDGKDEIVIEGGTLSSFLLISETNIAYTKIGTADEWVHDSSNSPNSGWHLRDGDRFVVADIDGDRKAEIIVTSADGNWIGILRAWSNNFQATWITNGWINDPGHTGASGWHLRKDDQFLAADIDGDGRKELIVRSSDGSWIGIIRENGGGLEATWITSGWINDPGHTGTSGWHLRKDDQFLAADIDGDGRSELIVRSADGKWIGVVRENSGGLEATWITSGWINDPGHTGVSGWHLRTGDQLLADDIDGDGRSELLVIDSGVNWLGIIRESGGSLESPWIGNGWINEPNSTGNNGWHLRQGDSFVTARINSNISSNIIVRSISRSFTNWSKYKLSWDWLNVPNSPPSGSTGTTVPPPSGMGTHFRLINLSGHDRFIFTSSSSGSVAEIADGDSWEVDIPCGQCLEILAKSSNSPNYNPVTYDAQVYGACYDFVAQAWDYIYG